MSSSRNIIPNETQTYADLINKLGLNDQSSTGLISNAGSTPRSKSLQRDIINQTNYFDLSNLKQRKKQALQDSYNNNTNSQQSTIMNNFSSAYNNPLREKSIENDLIYSSSHSNDNSGDNTKSSQQNGQVVPKPPPGNPQRNGSLYQTRFVYRISSLLIVS
jgi:hypothetical protein